MRVLQAADRTASRWRCYDATRELKTSKITLIIYFQREIMFFFLFFRNGFDICNKCISLKLIYLNYIHFLKLFILYFFILYVYFYVFQSSWEKMTIII